MTLLTAIEFGDLWQELTGAAAIIIPIVTVLVSRWIKTKLSSNVATELLAPIEKAIGKEQYKLLKLVITNIVKNYGVKGIVDKIVEWLDILPLFKEFMKITLQKSIDLKLYDDEGMEKQKEIIESLITKL